MSTKYRKKLIEVALPLEAINAASAREKSIRHGHPSTLHLWWARRPLAAARAVLFAQLVDDPSSWSELFPTEEAQNHERQRLFRLIEDLVLWENSNNETVINAARLEIARSHARSSSSPKAKAVLAEGVTPEVVNEYLATELPPVHDPFAGGGTIPLEAQRLGLRAIATDLNPVAVMINKALIEIPPRFAGKPPVNPDSLAKDKLKTWKGAEGLAEDVRYYGAWMRDEAKKRIGHLYPEVALPAEYGGGKGTIIAWLWARTVPSPDPAFAGIHVPLMSTFWLSQKPGAEAWLEAVIDAKQRTWRFEVRSTAPSDTSRVSSGTKHGRGDFACLLSGAPIPVDYIREVGRSGKLGQRLVAIAVERKGGRAYLPASEFHENLARVSIPESAPTTQLPEQALGLRVQNYGLRAHRDLFTPRQLTALTTFSDLVGEAAAVIARDAERAGIDARGYATAVATYLGFAVDKMAEGNSAQCTWSPLPTKLHVVSTFGRQALSMIWDFAEANIFGNSAGTVDRVVENISKVVEPLGVVPATPGRANQASAVSNAENGCAISTDPPYYDNIGYAALSDFFYTWLRQSLRTIEPGIFTTMLTPKDEEVIAEPGRTGGDVDAARRRFEELLRSSFAQMSSHQQAGNVITVYYAFKQSETEDTEAGSAAASTGWETMLEALLASDFGIVATLPVRTEKSGGFREMNRNALASSVVLVCRRRAETAPTTTRGDFRRLLRKELPDALKKLQQGNIAPVDVAQASIGPGMEIFSRHKQVIEADGARMTVRSALHLINEVLDEYLASGEGDFDADTRFAITWYEQHGWEPGPFGDAETLAKARNVSVGGVVEAGICKSAAGKVRILKRPEMRPLDYDPAADERPTVWEFTQHMIRNLEDEGEEAAARLLKKLGSAADATRELAYRLYNTCERKKWSEDARSYNALILAWTELEKLAARMGGEAPPAAPSKPSKASNGKKKTAKTKAPKKGQQALFEGDD
jgi:putative DNA methylase